MTTFKQTAADAMLDAEAAASGTPGKYQQLPGSEFKCIRRTGGRALINWRSSRGKVSAVVVLASYIETLTNAASPVQRDLF